jgi:hypothetical protein
MTPRTIIPDARPLPVSPEVSDDWRCPRCENTERFIGVDSDGWGGPDECECEASAPDAPIDALCVCTAVLRQPLRIADDGDVIYSAFTGGGSDAEIGEYDEIECAECGFIIWRQEGL